jgi:predicted CxxxxCH...CXXCH cytochrome family protein
MGKITLGTGLILALTALAGSAHAAGYSHAESVTTFDGPRTCTASSCHPDAAKEVAESLHYQQQAVPQFLEGWDAGKQAGMMVSY